MGYVLCFLSGLFLGNGIPHFANGVSGRDFHNPSLHRFFSGVPSPLFNTIWGLANFALAGILMTLAHGVNVGANLRFAAFVGGFCFASIGLSVYFRNRQAMRDANAQVSRG